MPRRPLAALLAAAAACGAPPLLRQEDVAPRTAVTADRPAGSSEPADPAADREELLRLMREFAGAFEQIERNYATEVDREDLIEAAIDGMVARLDPYSTYLDDEEVAEFGQAVEGSFTGVGVQILPNPASGRLTILAPIPGSPAAEAGVRAGDVIVRVDGEDVTGLDPSAVTARVKGEAGAPVTLGLLRPDSATPDEVEEVTVVRAAVVAPSVVGDRRGADGEWDFLLPGEPRVGLLRVSRFGPGTARELRRALVQLEERGAEGVILDLRGNPGGLLTQAVAVADLFLGGGRIVSTAGRNVPGQAFDALPGGPAEELAVAVLVDRFSASASEIVAAALQDAGRAAVVGERTFGKGSVQSVIDLGGGRSALKLTIAAYRRPSGANIQRPGPMADDAEVQAGDWGVRPDDGREVTLTPKQRRAAFGTRVDRDRPDSAAEVDDPQFAAALDAVRERIAN